MSNVKCCTLECIHNDNYICSENEITLDFESFELGECEHPCDYYADITETAEYQIPYFKRVTNPKTSRTEKQLARGKRLELFGMIFFTEEDMRLEEDYGMTEEISGFYITTKNLNKHYKEIPGMIKDLVPAKDLPDYEGEFHE